MFDKNEKNLKQKIKQTQYIYIYKKTNTEYTIKKTFSFLNSEILSFFSFNFRLLLNVFPFLSLDIYNNLRLVRQKMKPENKYFVAEIFHIKRSLSALSVKIQNLDSYLITKTDPLSPGKNTKLFELKDESQSHFIFLVS